MTDEDRQTPITLGPVTVVRAFRPGDVVFIETSQYYPDETLKMLHKQADLLSERYGVKIVLLGCGMKVASAGEAPDLAVQS